MAEDQDETIIAGSESTDNELYDDDLTPLPGKLTSQEVDLHDDPFPEDEATINTQTTGHLRDRLAAFLIDSLLLVYLYFILLWIYRYVVWDSPFGGIPTQHPHFQVLHGIFLLLGFFYFLICESVFFATFGKLLTSLIVRQSDGGIVRLFSVFLRTLLKPIDLILSPFIGWILLEKTAFHQRLGDLLAGTIVVKRYSWQGTKMPTSRKTASATLRLFVGMLDLFFFLAWIGGFFLFLDANTPFQNFVLFLASPLMILTWHLTWETVGQSTPGKWLTGLRLRHENGRPLSFGGAFWRTMLRLVDWTPFSLLAILLSKKKQRFGDLVGQSVVIHEKRQLRGGITFLGFILVTAALWAIGTTNPRHYLTPFFKADTVMKSITLPLQGMTVEVPAIYRGLSIRRFLFLNSDGNLKTSNTYKPGETALLQFELVGFTVRDGAAWIQQDLTVRYPDGSIGLKQENIIDFHKTLQNPEAPLEFKNRLELPANGQSGRYAIVLTVRDKLSGKQLTEQKLLMVEKPLSGRKPQ